jgi:hypothetical protein
MNAQKRFVVLVLVGGSFNLPMSGAFGFEEVDDKKKTTRIFERPANPVPPRPASTLPNRTIGDERDDEEPRYIPESLGDVIATEKRSRRSPLISDLPVSIMGSIGFAQESFFGKLTVGYGLYEYLGVDTTAFYLSDQNRHTQRKSYGTDIALVGKIPNRTIFTPFVGAGPGYEKWSYQKDGETYDNSQALTAFYYWGVLVTFTKHFGLTLSRRMKYFLTDTPLEEDGKTRINNPLASIDAGFTVMF